MNCCPTGAPTVHFLLLIWAVRGMEIRRGGGDVMHHCMLKQELISRWPTLYTVSTLALPAQAMASPLSADSGGDLAHPQGAADLFCDNKVVLWGGWFC